MRWENGVGYFGGRKPVEFDVLYPQGRMQYFWIAKIRLTENLAVGTLLTWDEKRCPCLSHPVPLIIDVLFNLN
eukprot:14730743-Ditylum_brightwellii.AAC.1